MIRLPDVRWESHNSGQRRGYHGQATRCHDRRVEDRFEAADEGCNSAAVACVHPSHFPARYKALRNHAKILLDHFLLDEDQWGSKNDGISTVNGKPVQRDNEEDPRDDIHLWSRNKPCHIRGMFYR